MTEKEIVQALRICASHETTGCWFCPQRKFVRCQERLAGETIRLIERLAADRKALINELCQYCGKYKYAHDGACDGCRWKGET